MKERTKMCNKLITSDDIHFLYPRLHRLDKPETSIMKTLKTNLMGHSYSLECFIGRCTAFKHFSINCLHP